MAPDDDGRPPVCFARSSLVSLADGETIRMDDLKVGHLVQTTDLEGNRETSKFVGWTEKHSSLTEFYKLTTEAGNVLKLTGEYISAGSFSYLHVTHRSLCNLSILDFGGTCLEV